MERIDDQALWIVLHGAYLRTVDMDHASSDEAIRRGYAAELEALADWLVPNEPEPRRRSRNSLDPLVGYNEGFDYGQHVARMTIRRRILNQALRADNGAG